MSEEKFYMVKNNKGEYWDFKDKDGFWELDYVRCLITNDEEEAKDVIRDYGGHIIKEPKKVVLSKEQAKIVEDAHNAKRPASYIILKSNDEELLMNAYVNGYTIKEDKKYNVKVPHAEGWHFQKYSSASKLGSRNNWRPFPAKDIDSNMSRELFQFTESEINHYGLQDCEKEEVIDDGE